MRRPLNGKALVVLYFALVLPLATVLPMGRNLYDFGSFYLSGTALLKGENPYDSDVFVREALGSGFLPTTPNLNPPLLLPLFAGLARLDPVFGFRLWLAISLASYFAAVWLLLRQYPPQRFVFVWAIMQAGAWHCLQLGQVYLLLSLIVTGAWLLLERDRRLEAGVLIGLLVAVKPNFILWPLLLLLRGYGRTTLVAAASALILSAGPALVYGPSIYAEWVAGITAHGDFVAFITNVSLVGVVARLGLTGRATEVILGAAAIVPVVMIVLSRRLGWKETSSLSLVAAMLASPIAWVGYTSLLVPAYLSRRWSRATTASAVLLAVPPMWVAAARLGSPLLNAIAGLIYPVALMLFVADILHDQNAHGSTASPMQ